MNERSDFEDLLWSASDEAAAAAAAGERRLEDQLEMHRLLGATIARLAVPEPSAYFDQLLGRRLRRGADRRPLRGRALLLMTLYWLAFAVGVAIVVADLDLPAPPAASWTLALWSVLVPASFFGLFFGRRPRSWLRRIRLSLGL